MKISFYTRSGISSPSSNYRILQYTKILKTRHSNIFVREMTSNYIYKKHSDSMGKRNRYFWYVIYYLMIQIRMTGYFLYDIFKGTNCIVICRAMSPKVILFINRFLYKILLSKKVKVIWDFDDDIFSSKEITTFEKELLFKRADIITVTNKRLLSLLPEEIHNKVIFLPTTDGCFSNSNPVNLIEKRKYSYQNEIGLLWLATAPSLPNLDLVADLLERSAEILQSNYGKKLVLNVVCNRPYRTDFKYLVINNVMWNKEIAIEYTIKSHIGIMPLYDTQFNEKKGGFKLIQYMSAAMPTIGSAVGYNEDIIKNEVDGFLVDEKTEENKWIKSILCLSTDWDRYQNMSLLSRKKWDESFSFTDNYIFWENIVQSTED